MAPCPGGPGQPPHPTCASHGRSPGRDGWRCPVPHRGMADAEHFSQESALFSQAYEKQGGTHTVWFLGVRDTREGTLGCRAVGACCCLDMRTPYAPAGVVLGNGSGCLWSGTYRTRERAALTWSSWEQGQQGWSP